MRHAGVVSVGLGLLVLAVAAAPAHVASMLAYERTAIEAGQLWRLLTCHLVHLGTRHLAGNLVMLAAITALFAGELTRCHPARTVAVCAASVGVGLYLFHGNLDRYVGLSGVWHGLLAAGAAVALRERPGVGIVALVLLFVKLGYERWSGPLPGSEALAGGSVIVAAHLFGAAGGALAALPAITRSGTAGSHPAYRG